MALSIIPDICYSLVTMIWPELYEGEPFAVTASLHIVRAIQICAPLLYILWRAGEPFTQFGLVRPVWLVDIPLGLAIWFGGHLLYVTVARSVSFLPDIKTAPFPPVVTVYDFLLLPLYAVAVGFSEELVVRGYLFPRFQHLCGSTWQSLLLTSLLFAAYHLYQGPQATLGVAALGFFYGLAFWRLQRLWPLVVAHSFTDFIAEIW